MKNKLIDNFDIIITFPGLFIEKNNCRIGGWTWKTKAYSRLMKTHELLKDCDFFRSELDKYHKEDVEEHLKKQAQPKEEPDDECLVGWLVAFNHEHSSNPIEIEFPWQDYAGISKCRLKHWWGDDFPTIIVADTLSVALRMAKVDALKLLKKEEDHE